MASTQHADLASYKASGFNGRMGWGQRPALLLIDVCKAYWCSGSPLDTSANPASVASLEVMKRLLATARESKVPVIWTQVSYKKGMKDAGLFYRKSRVLDVWEEGNTRGYDDLVTGLEPAEGEEVVVKKHPSAFYGTELASQLHLMNVDTLVICGVSTSGCVRASTLDAMCYNYRPMVVGSACGDRSAAIHNANIFDMDAKMADVVSEDEAIEHLKAGWS
ncbi:N-carbamoylsarcosine amidase [Teratosphaeria nubilosa]|uniref:N-carbamoylsarcosine amidase n=1 Tax=Teratosphaeria nubilosa TaxID=161662 RepID=A0A6G1L3X9_9PEZI|nr:N-carbamoylsarcosine amidase [Teratosphaeria nubilosa]